MKLQLRRKFVEKGI